MMIKQSGQALTEFLVAAIAIIPLILLIPLIGKYQDINHATQAASRYAAFDATVRNDSQNSWKSPEQLAQEVRRRFFSNHDAPIKTGDAAGNFKAHQNLFWRGVRDEPLITDINNDVQVSFGGAAGSDHGSAFSGASDGQPFLLRNPLNLQARGIYTANISVSLANLPAGLKFYEPFDQLNLRVTRSTSVGIDSWNARDPAQVESRISASPLIFPAGALSGVNGVLGTAVSIIDTGGVANPRLGELEFWRDSVPQDRLRSRN